MFSSATVILFGGTVGALAYLESSAANADKLLEEISLFYKVLCTILHGWGGGGSSSQLMINPWCWVPGGKLMQGISASLSSPSKVVPLKREK